MHKRIKQTWTHKKPVRRNTFLQGTEILQIFKKKEKKKKQKQSKLQTPQQTIGVTVTRTWGNQDPAGFPSSIHPRNSER